MPGRCRGRHLALMRQAFKLFYYDISSFSKQTLYTFCYVYLLFYLAKLETPNSDIDFFLLEIS